MKNHKMPWGQYWIVDENLNHTLIKVELNPGNIYTGQNKDSIMICTLLTGSCSIAMNNSKEHYHTGQIVRIPELMQYRIENPHHEASVFYVLRIHNKI